MNIPQELYTRLSLRMQSIMLDVDEYASGVELLEKLYEAQGSFASNFLQLEGVKAEHFSLLRKRRREMRGSSKGTKSEYPGSGVKSCLLEGARFASEAGHRLIGTQHILYALILAVDQDPSLKEFFRQVSCSIKRLKSVLEDIVFHDIMMSKHPSWSEGDMAFGRSDELHHVLHRERHLNAGSKSLGGFVQDLIDKARQGSFDPLIGRQREVERMIQILSRRNKCNPILVGDPGVGKTAIVYGLAQKIINGEVPFSLREKSILALNLSSMVAGTMFRGDFESRMEAVLKEVKLRSSILFIDEIHNVVGTGSVMGTLDAANILKPALSEGDIQVIGSTTYEEYKLYIENDKALERRFQPIFVDEPSAEEAMEILKGLKKRYETYHGIRIHPKAIRAAVMLSDRYIRDRFLPDKALDVLDEAAALANISQSSSEVLRKLEELKLRVSLLRREKEEKTRQGLYETAFALKKEEEALLKKIWFEESMRKRDKKFMLSANDIKRVMTSMTGVPLEEMTAATGKRLSNLEKEIERDVIGQEEAVKALADAMRRARAGLQSEHRPLGSFLFIGPSGVGKTELARVLARRLFGPDSFIKLDMSEFMEPHSISRLIGAPAGYVGYGKGGELTEKIRHNPHSIVLFDEIEKAHPQVFNLLLQILEDGELSDAMGLEVDFKNAVIILTSNLGTEKLFETKGEIGFEANVRRGVPYEEIKNAAMDSLHRHLRPELVNRIDDIIVFRPLELEHIKKIVALQLSELALRALHDKGMHLSYGETVTEWVAQKAFNITQGARLVRRVIEKEVSDPLASRIIAGEVQKGRRVALLARRGSLSMRIEKSREIRNNRASSNLQQGLVRKRENASTLH